MSSMMKMSMALKVIQSVAKMNKPLIYSKDEGFKIIVNSDDSFSMDATAIDLSTGESFRYAFDKDDRENYQYIMLNGKHLSLLAVNRHTTRIES